MILFMIILRTYNIFLMKKGFLHMVYALKKDQKLIINTKNVRSYVNRIPCD